MHIGTIAFLLLALLVIVAVLMGTGTVTDFFKKVFDMFGAKHKDADICNRYKNVTDMDGLRDLIYYVKNGYCGGDRKDDAFLFVINKTDIVHEGLQVPSCYKKNPYVDCPITGFQYFCGGKDYVLNNYPETPPEVPRNPMSGTPVVWMQFGDIEVATGEDCEYSEGWIPFEDQACLGSDDSDLVIMGPQQLRGQGTGYPCNPAAMNTPIMPPFGKYSQYWCAQTEGFESSVTSHTVLDFAIKPVPLQVITSYEGTMTLAPKSKEATWAIRREKEDVVLCLLTKAPTTT